MPLTLWTDDYEVGVESLDGDHIVIFSLINDVDDAIRSGKNEKVVRQILKVLIYHAVAHFQREEMLMRKHGYPGTEAHTAEHFQIMSELQGLLADQENTPAANVSGKVVDVLTTWVNVHVPNSDMQYRVFFKDRAA